MAVMKAAIIGGGFIAEFHGEAYNALGKVKLCGICDVNREQAGKMAEKLGCTPYYNAEEMLKTEKPDVVSVCLPTFLHEEYTRLALRCGANVLCEKPISLTLDSIERMGEEARKNGLLLMTGQVLRWWPEYQTIREELSCHGLPLFVTSRRLQHASRVSWMPDPKKGGGVLFDLFVHDIDYLCCLLGYQPSIESVNGNKGEGGSWRRVCANLVFSGGTHASIEASNMMPAGFPFSAEFRADFPDACLLYRFRAPVNIQKDAITQTEFLMFENGETKVLPFPPLSQSKAFFGEIQSFVEGVQNGVSPLPIEDTYRVMKVIHQVKEKLEQET